MSERQKDRHSHRVSFTLPKEDWKELGELLDGNPDGVDRSELLRRFVRAMLKRPGAKMPRRRDYDQAADSEKPATTEAAGRPSGQRVPGSE